MKKYLVIIKKVQITQMVVSEKSKSKAINKVTDLLNNRQINSENVFDKKPTFYYKAIIYNK